MDAIGRFYFPIFIKLELVYLPKGKYWVYPRRAYNYRLAILVPPG